MYGIECPICKKTYINKPERCVCGFEGLGFAPIAEGEELDRFMRDELFEIFKFTKKVYYGKIPYAKDAVEVDCRDGRAYINYVYAKRGLALVDGEGEMPTVACNGMMPFTGVSSLIVNVDELNADALDESTVKILFLGERVTALTDGYLGACTLRYIFVDSNNPRFSHENNVLFNKDKTELIKYARLRPEGEYTVPKSVKRIARRAFDSPKYLKTLRLPSGVSVEGSLSLGDGTEIIYY